MAMLQVFKMGKIMGTEEYKVLRDELNIVYQNITNYNIALYTASSVIFAFTMEQDAFYYSLIPLLVMLPLYLLGEHEHKKACRLGAYLYVFCEGKEFHWERRHHRFDKRGRSRKRDNSEILSYIVIAFVSCLFSAIKLLSNSQLNKCYLLIPVICLIISIVIIVKMKVNYVEIRGEYIDKWKEIKLEEQKNKSHCRKKA